MTEAVKIMGIHAIALCMLMISYYCQKVGKACVTH